MKQYSSNKSIYTRENH